MTLNLTLALDLNLTPILEPQPRFKIDIKIHLDLAKAMEKPRGRIGIREERQGHERLVIHAKWAIAQLPTLNGPARICQILLLGIYKPRRQTAKRGSPRQKWTYCGSVGLRHNDVGAH